MIDKLKPYPAYKDSGARWLGKVPEHWEVQRIKRIAMVNPSRTGKLSSLSPETLVTFLPMEKVRVDGTIDSKERVPASSVWSGFTNFCRGDVIVAKITPCFENGKGACLDKLPTEVGFGSTEFHVLRPLGEITSRFLYRITTTSDFRLLGRDSMTGAAGQQRVPSGFVENLRVAFPQLPEQTMITEYLDFIDRRIRRYIAAKKKLIKLLEEYKQALIHRAVTGQIDVRTGKPYPKYKDSGVEWLGKIPEHWEVRRMKATMKNIVQNTRELLDGEVYIALENVESWSGDLKFYNSEASFDSQVKRFSAGDVLFGKLRPYLAKVTRPVNDGVCVGEFFVLRAISSDVCSEYVEIFLRTKAVIEVIDSSTFGAKMPRTNWDFFGGLPVLIPSVQEQSAIVDYLRSRDVKIGKLLVAELHLTRLLKELRTRLIADVVTGKLDVRQAAANLPEEPEDIEDTEIPLEEEELAEDIDLEAITEEVEK